MQPHDKGVLIALLLRFALSSRSLYILAGAQGHHCYGGHCYGDASQKRFHFQILSVIEQGISSATSARGGTVLSFLTFALLRVLA